MANKKTYVVKLRRKREGKTNYKKRIKLLLSETPRLVIRKSLKNMSAQIVEYHSTGDKVLVVAHTKELEKLGWKGSRKNIPASYLCGLLLAKKAAKKGVKKAIADFGLNTPNKGSRFYAVLKGAKEGGLDLSAPDDIMPSEDRLNGKHIAEFSKKAQEIHKTQFSKYLKNGLEPENIEKQIQEIKKKLTA